MENVFDPAHVPVSHHNIVGSRYEKGQYYDMTRLETKKEDRGFKFSVDKEVREPGVTDVTIEFEAPSLCKIETTYENNGKQLLLLYATPTRPGFCRHINAQVFVKGDDGKLPPGAAFFATPMPIWLNHVLAPVFLHQDLAFLHAQEKILASRGYAASATLTTDDRDDGDKKYSEVVYAPNPQDKMVLTFRNWLRNKAGGKIPFARGLSLPGRESDSRRLFDSWTAHTKSCKVCLDALRNVKKVRFVSTILAAVTLALAKDTLRALLGASFFGAIALASHKLVGLFYAYEFSHADND